MKLTLPVQAAMRRAGHNPTDVEVTDIINKIDSDAGNIDFQVGGLTIDLVVSVLSGVLLSDADQGTELRHGVRLQGDLQGLQQR